MERVESITCPNCSKALYDSDFDIYDSCTHCGFVFNWQGPDRRIFKRKKEETPMILELNRKTLFNAETLDISKKGAGVIVPSHFFDKKGDQIRCNFNGDKEMRDTKIVWSVDSKKSQKVGLLLYEEVY